MNYKSFHNAISSERTMAKMCVCKEMVSVPVKAVSKLMQPVSIVQNAVLTEEMKG